MSDRSREIVREVLRRRPESRADALGIDLSKDEPAQHFQWLVASLLFSARISADQAERAAKALFDQGWTTPEKMAATSWEERVKVLNANGYARYDESTSRYLGEGLALLRERWGNDLRNLREEAGRKPAKERELLKEFKGIGDVGADIYLREAQLAWEENHPFADRRAQAAAEALGLDPAPERLAELAGKRDLPRLLDALVWIDLNDEAEAVKAAV
ncbi:MAG: hypothetical protein ACQEUZ_11990 [Pseudomonadota bacterium]